MSCQKCEKIKNKKWIDLWYDKSAGHAFRFCYDCFDYFDDADCKYHECPINKKVYCESHSYHYKNDEGWSFCANCIDDCVDIIYDYNCEKERKKQKISICEAENRSPNCKIEIRAPVMKDYHKMCYACEKFSDNSS